MVVCLAFRDPRPLAVLLNTLAADLLVYLYLFAPNDQGSIYFGSPLRAIQDSTHIAVLAPRQSGHLLQIEPSLEGM